MVKRIRSIWGLSNAFKFSQMLKLWVKFGGSNATQVSTEGCLNIDDFIEAVKKKLQISNPAQEISISLTEGGKALDPDDSVPLQNTAKTPLYISVTESSFTRSPIFTPCQIPFYNKIHSASESDGWISFEETIPSSTLSQLYIRNSYQIIVSSISHGYQTIASTTKHGVYKAIITGTPGIGKSLFMIYLLWKLVKEGKRVLFIYHPDTIYYDGKGGVYELESPPSVVNHEFWKSDLWCLFDAKGKKDEHLSALPYGRCNFILSTSPRREMINDFKKPPVPNYFYMPLWTEEELDTIAPKFPNSKEWHDRFKILGGIPRFVLEHTGTPPKLILEGACKECTLDDCIKIIGLNSTITEKLKVIHSLVHITSISPFTVPSVRYASQTALDIIVRNKMTDAKRKIRELLESSEGNPLTAALCGYIFEPYVLELLEKEGKFKCRQLVHGNKKIKTEETDLTIPPSAKIVVDRVDSNQTGNQLYVPKTKNYTAIDAWIPGIGAFQMTVGRTRDIKGGAVNDLALLGTNGNKLYWLLPPLYYKSFTKKTPQDIDQYAVKIPYPTVDE